MAEPLQNLETENLGEQILNLNLHGALADL